MLEKLPINTQGYTCCPYCGKPLMVRKVKKGYMSWCTTPGCHSYKVFHQEHDTLTCDHVVKKTKHGTGWLNLRCPVCKYSAFVYTVRETEKAPAKVPTR